jgi:serine/threonine-protein kinase
MATVHFGRLVGHGGFARPVAIKRLHRQFARDPEFVNMFLDEARLAARVAHPNVVQTLDIVASADEVFLVMEYVHGATLAQLVRAVGKRRERIPPMIAIGIVCGILHGLHAAHEARDNLGERLDLIHRDVSPHNVLVGPDGVARLLDFGIAKATGRLQTTREGQLKGKLAYMAPEQALGAAVTSKADIFAASVVLWELLTGARLFYAGNEAHVLSRVLTAEVRRPSAIVPGLPPAVDRVVLRGLERDPARRYATAREMAKELAACSRAPSPTEVGDWVELMVGDELRERAGRVATIERRAVESAAAAGDVSAAPDSGVSDPVTPSGGIYAWGAPADAAQDAGSPSTRPAKLRSRVIALAAAAVLAAGGLLSSHAMRSNDARAGTRSAAAHAAMSSAPLVAGAPAGAESSVPAPVAEGSIAAQSVAVAPATPSSSGSSSEAARARPKHIAVPTNAAAAFVSSRPVGDSCDPPYTTDARGHVHFKPNCI